MLAALADDLNTPAADRRACTASSDAARRRAATLRLARDAAGLGLLPEIACIDWRRATAALGADDAGGDRRLIAARIAARTAKNFAESDRIRDELAAMGIQLKDGKDPATRRAASPPGRLKR